MIHSFVADILVGLLWSASSLSAAEYCTRNFALLKEYSRKCPEPMGYYFRPKGQPRRRPGSAWRRCEQM